MFSKADELAKSLLYLLLNTNNSMDNYLIGIGKRIKEIRKRNKYTITQVATKAEVSNGLISKIENGRTIPSLPVLLHLIQALDVEVGEFFKHITLAEKGNFVLCKQADYTVIEKEEMAVGFEYRSIFSKQLNSCGFETVLLEIKPNSKRDKVETDAFEFKYMIKGECTYVIGEEEVLVQTGDSILFDGRIPHVPINQTQENCLMLVVYFFYDKNDSIL
ncbi:transcriptional regulator with XRE-family HTH domain [Myroides gitamensis]|nr:transcriptional regulator with XRE-family HTH domain [Myroides gitamensis]